ncbi:MAG: tRNA epoxyqueuosine(34) reductase QueG [Anaerolineae bacterium]|nr:tRNA epoxyqueuosine(34) reductase QueG [Anaerolineae bacterium]
MHTHGIPATAGARITEARIAVLAAELGFDLAGVVPAGPAHTFERYTAWLDAGHHGEMGYMARADAVERRADPRHILPGAESVVVVGLNYHTVALPAHLRDAPSRGIMASYAWGVDYHDVMTPRLRTLAARIEAEAGHAVAHRAYVDTGAILERDWAVRAGLGFLGRNTALIHPRLGSWLFLGELLLAAPVEPSWAPPATGTCGQCTRCLEACPTNAFPAPGVLDARRCISYLTIELQGPIPRELRPLMGNRIFGCDVCQEVCPWNRRFAAPTAQPAFWPGPDAIAPPLLDLIDLDDEALGARFTGSPILRAKRRGLLRNVAVALGNWGDAAAIPALIRALGDAEPLVRGHAAWALGRIGTHDARRALLCAMAGEGDDWVRAEIMGAIPGADSE